jgi:hypothetical protein
MNICKTVPKFPQNNGILKAPALISEKKEIYTYSKDYPLL